MEYTKQGNVILMNVNATHPDTAELFYKFTGSDGKVKFMRIAIQEEIPPVFTEEEFRKRFPYYDN